MNYIRYYFTNLFKVHPGPWIFAFVITRIPVSRKVCIFYPDITSADLLRVCQRVRSYPNKVSTLPLVRLAYSHCVFCFTMCVVQHIGLLEIFSRAPIWSWGSPINFCVYKGFLGVSKVCRNNYGDFHEDCI